MFKNILIITTTLLALYQTNAKLTYANYTHNMPTIISQVPDFFATFYQYIDEDGKSTHYYQNTRYFVSEKILNNSYGAISYNSNEGLYAAKKDATFSIATFDDQNNFKLTKTVYKCTKSACNSDDYETFNQYAMKDVFITQCKNRDTGDESINVFQTYYDVCHGDFNIKASAAAPAYDELYVAAIVDKKTQFRVYDYDGSGYKNIATLNTSTKITKMGVVNTSVAVLFGENYLQAIYGDNAFETRIGEPVHENIVDMMIWADFIVALRIDRDASEVNLTLYQANGKMNLYEVDNLPLNDFMYNDNAYLYRNTIDSNIVVAVQTPGFNYQYLLIEPISRKLKIQTIKNSLNTYIGPVYLSSNTDNSWIKPTHNGYVTYNKDSSYESFTKTLATSSTVNQGAYYTFFMAPGEAKYSTISKYSHKDKKVITLDIDNDGYAGLNNSIVISYFSQNVYVVSNYPYLQYINQNQVKFNFSINITGCRFEGFLNTDESEVQLIGHNDTDQKAYLWTLDARGGDLISRVSIKDFQIIAKYTDKRAVQAVSNSKGGSTIQIINPRFLTVYDSIDVDSKEITSLIEVDARSAAFVDGDQNVFYCENLKSCEKIDVIKYEQVYLRPINTYSFNIITYNYGFGLISTYTIDSKQNSSNSDDDDGDDLSVDLE